MFEDLIDQDPIEETKGSGWSGGVVSPPAAPVPSSSMEEKQLQQTLNLLKEVQEVLRETEKAKEDVSGLVQSFIRYMESLKELCQDFEDKNGELSQKLETLHFTMSEESLNFIRKQFAELGAGFMKDTKDGLLEIKKEFLNGLKEETKAVIADEQKRIKDVKDEYRKYREDKEKEDGRGIYLGRVSLMTSTYLLFVVISGYCASIWGMSIILKSYKLEDYVFWYVVALFLPLFCWVGRFIWRKWL